MKKFLHATAALALVAAASLSSTAPAEAGRGGRVAAGVVAGTLLGLGIAGAVARDRYSCYEGPRRCEVVGERCHYNRYGDYRCRDEVRCWRPRRCDW